MNSAKKQSGRSEAKDLTQKLRVLVHLRCLHLVQLTVDSNLAGHIIAAWNSHSFPHQASSTPAAGIAEQGTG